MDAMTALLADLNESKIAQRVGNAHDEARMAYHPRSNTVRDFREFTGLIGNFVQHQYSRCVSQGGRLSGAEAAGRGKELIDQELRRQGGGVVSCFRDCCDGVNGGVRRCLDILCEGMKAEAIEYYTRDVFDRYMPPDNWPLRVRMVSQFIRRCPIELYNIDPSTPDRYARDLEELIRAFVRGLRQVSSVFRRL